MIEMDSFRSLVLSYRRFRVLILRFRICIDASRYLLSALEGRSRWSFGNYLSRIMSFRGPRSAEYDGGVRRPCSRRATMVRWETTHFSFERLGLPTAAKLIPLSSRVSCEARVVCNSVGKKTARFQIKKKKKNIQSLYTILLSRRSR